MKSETYQICCKRGSHRTQCPLAAQYGGHCTECPYVFYIKREPLPAEEKQEKQEDNNSSND